MAKKRKTRRQHDVERALRRIAQVEWRGGQLMVARSVPRGVDDLTPADGLVPARPFVGPPAYVGARYSMTVNLGNYNSCRVEVSVSMPCYPSEANDMHAWCQAWGLERLRAELRELRSAIAESRNDSRASLDATPPGFDD